LVINQLNRLKHKLKDLVRNQYIKNDINLFYIIILICYSYQLSYIQDHWRYKILKLAYMVNNVRNIIYYV